MLGRPGRNRQSDEIRQVRPLPGIDSLGLCDWLLAIERDKPRSPESKWEDRQAWNKGGKDPHTLLLPPTLRFWRCQWTTTSLAEQLASPDIVSPINVIHLTSGPC